MGLRYATVTGVARDDLPDGGAWLYAETVRQIHAPAARLRRRAADPRLQRRPRPARRGLRLPPRGARAQRRDGAADLQADPPRLPLRPLPRRCITAAREAGLVTKSNLILGMGEEPHEVVEAHAGPARRRLRPAHDHPVPAALAAAPPRRPLGEARRVRRASRPRPSGSASRACSPARWCAVPTGPAGSTSRPSRPAGSPAWPEPRGGRRGAEPAARPYPVGMARSKPTDATAPGGKAGRTPQGRRPRPLLGLDGCLGQGPEAGQEGPAEGGPAEEVGRPVGMIKQAYSLTRKNDPKLAAGSC